MSVSIFDYEGAGTILYDKTKDSFILGISQKSGEFEYMGGKVEKGENPLQTAINELHEETGYFWPIIDTDGTDHILIFQPFSKKWIWCFTHTLTENEKETMKRLDIDLDKWPENETRDLSVVTGRTEPARKAIKGLYHVKRADFFEYIERFVVYEPKTTNRMKDAKAYGADPETKLLTGKRISDESDVTESKLRGFNVVMFEQHLKKLKESF